MWSEACTGAVWAAASQNDEERFCIVTDNHCILLCCRVLARRQTVWQTDSFTAQGSIKLSPYPMVNTQTQTLIQPSLTHIRTFAHARRDEASLEAAKPNPD